MKSIHIRCPKCQWQPDGLPHWQCSCGIVWNTFETAGRCPSCGKVWEDTQCVSPAYGGCARWSPHLEWYEGLDDAVEKLKAEIKEGWKEKMPG